MGWVVGWVDFPINYVTLADVTIFLRRSWLVVGIIIIFVKRRTVNASRKDVFRCALSPCLLPAGPLTRDLEETPSVMRSKSLSSLSLRRSAFLIIRVLGVARIRPWMIVVWPTHQPTQFSDSQNVSEAKSLFAKHPVYVVRSDIGDIMFQLDVTTCDCRIQRLECLCNIKIGDWEIHKPIYIFGRHSPISHHQTEYKTIIEEAIPPNYTLAIPLNVND